MDRKLTKRLHPDYMKVSRISSLLVHAILFILVIGYLVLANAKGWWLFPGWIALAVFCITFALYSWLFPLLRYQRMAFEVFEEELEIRSGIVFISNVLVPMVRVQHVELESGPLMRRYGLAALSVVTAATTHRITGLQLEEANRYKRRIAELARVVDDDE